MALVLEPHWQNLSSRYDLLETWDFYGLLSSLKLTAKAPENGWLEDDISFSDSFLAGAMLVSGRVQVWCAVHVVTS